MLKRFMAFLSASFLSLWLLSWVSSASLAAIMTPVKLKSWLRNSSVYDTIVEDVIRQSQKSISQNPEGGTNPLNDDGVQTAAREAFTPAFLQASAEKVIDGTAPWLEGKAAKPQFTIDATEVKNTFADKLGAYELKRVSALPACATPPTSPDQDITSITCKPAGFNAEAEVQKAVTELKTSKEFLANPIITQDTVFKQQNGQPPLEERLKEVPKSYQAAKWLPWTFFGLSIIAALCLLWFSASKRRGWRRIASSMLFVGIFSLISVGAVNLAFSKLSDKIVDGKSLDAGMQRTLLSLTKQVMGDFNRGLFAYGLGLTLVGLGIVVYLVATRQRNKPLVGEPSTPTPTMPALPTDHQPVVNPVAPDVAAKPKKSTLK